jgi:hypothetical protein
MALTYLKNNFLPVVLMMSLLWIVLLLSGVILKSLLLILLVFIFPVILEICLRLFLYINFGSKYKYSILFYSLVSDKYLGYRFRRNISTPDQKFTIFDQFLNRWYFERPTLKNSNLINFQTDSLGFRGDGFDPKNKEAKLRIFCCGGSTTACNSVNDEDTWPAVLQLELRKMGFDVEVINAGVQGWHSYQDLKLIESEISRYQPDLILLHQGWNEEFEYSSLSLGRKWKPKTVRNEIEENFLYLPKNKFLSQKFSLIMLLAVRAISWRFVFKSNMSFSNVKRWKCLLSKKYLDSWFGNQIEIARLAFQKGYLLFNLDYPALVNITDSEIERKLLLNNERFNTRLDNNFADYQAISKQGITHFLEDVSPLIPRLDGSKIFSNLEIEDRILQFGDEVHFSTLGCKNFGVGLAQLLSDHPDFIKRYNGEWIQSNIDFHAINVSEIQRNSIHSKSYLHAMINRKINELEGLDSKQIDNNSIPDERYTTF